VERWPVSYLLEFDVAADLQFPGCPVCRAANRAAFEYLRGLLHEDLNNAQVHLALQRSQGLCREHSREAIEIAARDDDVIGAAVLVEFLLEVARGQLRGLGSPTTARWRSARRRGSALAASDCGACHAERRRATAYLQILLGADPHSPVRRALDLPDRGLCLPHVILGLDDATDVEARRWLVRLFDQRARHLQELAREALAGAGHNAPGASEEAARAVWSDGPAWLVGSPLRTSPR
jgi:hypothetical protein